MAPDSGPPVGSQDPVPTPPAPSFVIAGTNHRHAPIDVRERLAGAENLRQFLHAVQVEARPTVHLLLVTCNRIELWFLGAPRSEERVRRGLASKLEADPDMFYIRTGEAAIEHAVRVTTGMDSMAWGEPQIRAQVLQSLVDAEAGGTAGPGFSDLVRRISAAARRVRTAAGLQAKSSSAGDAAVNLLVSKYAHTVPKVLIMGTGKMGRVAARRLASSARLTIADRQFGRAEMLARELGAEPLPSSEATERLARFEAVVVATAAPSAILGRERLSAATRDRTAPLLIIDLSVPRNVDPAAGALPTVELVNLDGLEPWVTPPSEETIERATEAIGLETKRLARWLRARAADETVALLRERAEAIRKEELFAASHRLRDVSPDALAVLDKMTSRIVNRLLHDPTEGIRAAVASDGTQREYERLVRDLFRLTEGTK